MPIPIRRGMEKERQSTRVKTTEATKRPAQRGGGGGGGEEELDEEEHEQQEAGSCIAVPQKVRNIVTKWRRDSHNVRHRD
jgi:hypothetical protein